MIAALIGVGGLVFINLIVAVFYYGKLSQKVDYLKEIALEAAATSKTFEKRLNLHNEQITRLETILDMARQDSPQVARKGDGA